MLYVATFNCFLNIFLMLSYKMVIATLISSIHSQNALILVLFPYRFCGNTLQLIPQFIKKVTWFMYNNIYVLLLE